MRTGGTGGANTNRTGLKFENCLRRHQNGRTYIINDITFLYLEKGRLAKYLPKHEYEKDLQPDASYINEETKTIYILEYKNQITPGSTDEKIQTGPFKLKKYAKRYPDYTFYFAYVLSEWWFNRKDYKDDIEILKESDIEIFWGKIKVQTPDTQQDHTEQMNDLVVELVVRAGKIETKRYPREYETDFDLIDSWMTRQVLQSS